MDNTKDAMQTNLNELHEELAIAGKLMIENMDKIDDLKTVNRIYKWTIIGLVLAYVLIENVMR